MNLKVMVTRDDLKMFFMNNNFNELQQDFISKNSIDFLVENIWLANLLLFEKYKKSFLIMYSDKCDNYTLLGFCQKPSDGTIEISSFYADVHNKIFITKAFKHYIEYVLATDNVNRFQSTIEVSNKGSLNIHKKYGFEIEGILHKYDGINDYYMVAKYE